MADTARVVKRFYEKAELRSVAGASEILLDGRPVKTLAKNPLLAPTEPLGEAIAAEWNGQGDKIDPRSMPMTGFTNAAIDRVAPDPQAFAAGLAVFGESDLLYYRAEAPSALVSRQAERWDPLLAWARRRFDVDFDVVSGVIHRPQPTRTLDQLRKAVEARNAFELAALSPLVTISGSLVIALALAEGAIDVETAWAAATLDEAWQAEQWGEDAEAAAVLEARRKDFGEGYRFLQLLGSC